MFDDLAGENVCGVHNGKKSVDMGRHLQATGLDIYIEYWAMKRVTKKTTRHRGWEARLQDISPYFLWVNTGNQPQALSEICDENDNNDDDHADGRDSDVAIVT